MKLLASLIICSLFLLFCCKRKSAPEAQMLTYFVLIDEVHNTARGPVDTNSVETIYAKNDEAAISIGIQKYYNEVVKTETRSKGIDQPLPYLMMAKGWAVLDEKGDNVKARVRPGFVDSSNQQAVEKAKYDIEHLQVQ